MKKNKKRFVVYSPFLGGLYDSNLEELQLKEFSEKFIKETKSFTKEQILSYLKNYQNENKQH